MNYISIDIETTGLDEEWCQILEVGAVLADTEDFETAVCDLPTWSCRFYYDRVVGQPVALHMNAQLILEMEARDPIHNYMHPDSFWYSFTSWASCNAATRTQKLSFSGKNFGTFDSRFLWRLPRWSREHFRGRVIDPAVLFFRRGDEAMPDLKTCTERAGLEWDPAKHHRAVEDARLVVELNRAGLKRMWGAA